MSKTGDDYKDGTHWADISPLILAINTIGNDLIGLELGVERCDSFLTILHNCNNVKKLYGVDNWKPYYDFLKPEPDGKPLYYVNEQESEHNRSIAFSRLKYETKEYHNFEIIEKDSLIAAKDIPDSSLDFIFFDAMMSEEQTYAEALAYYPKIKKGRWFMGHDATCNLQVIQPIEQVKQKFNNTNELVCYGNCFLFMI
jgi:hypothetical protein